MTKTLIIGENVITDFLIPAGKYFGVNLNSGSLPGRFGVKIETAEYEFYYVTTTISTTPYTLPAASNTARYGIHIELENEDGLVYKVGTLYGKSISEDDLTINKIDEDGDNLFSDGTLVSDKLVSSDGGISSSVGWKYLDIGLDANQKNIFFSKIGIRPEQPVNGGYYRFVDSSGNLISFGGFIANEKVALEIPANAANFQIDLKSPTDSDDVYADAVITYNGLISEIKGHKLFSSSGSGGGGTGNFDQNLNTTDSVKFAGLETDALKVNGLPTAEEDTLVGGIWIDTANGNVLKVKMA